MTQPLDFKDSLKRLHKIVTQRYESTNALLTNYLSEGCQIFGLEVGIVSQITGDIYGIQSVNSNALDLNPGMEFPLEDSYCREVIKIKKTVSILEVGKDERLKQHPVYLATKLESYISSPIFVRGSIYGTINFSSQSLRQTPFSSEDLELIELMAESIGRFLEARDQERLIESQRLDIEKVSRSAALGRLTGGMAHELNNPLTIIKWVVDQERFLLGQGKELDPKSLEVALGKIDRAADRMTQILSNLLHYAREGFKDTPTNTNLKHLLLKNLQLVEASFTRNFIDLQYSPLKEDIWITIRPHDISQILLNLLNNALDAAREGEEKWVKVDLKVVEGMLRVSIKDSGPGVAPEIRRQIHEPFFTTKPFGEGMGLGLSLSQGIVESLGGRLFLDESSRSTCFVFEIPLETEDL